MPARKTTKKASKKRSVKSSAPDAGPVPPYGDPIRKAIARGDAREMKNVAASARKWMADVQAALDQLDSALKKR
jgi:hypothetical protein